MQASIDRLDLSYEQLMARWGRCVEGEQATVGFLLRNLRTHAGSTQVFQRCYLGMSDSDFRRLQRMLRPRADHFADDVQQMALACNITNIQIFVATMEQACRLVEQ